MLEGVELSWLPVLGLSLSWRGISRAGLVLVAAWQVADTELSCEDDIGTFNRLVETLGKGPGDNRGDIW